MEVSWSGLVRREYCLAPPPKPASTPRMQEQQQKQQQGETPPTTIVLQACYSDGGHLLAAGTLACRRVLRRTHMTIHSLEWKNITPYNSAFRRAGRGERPPLPRLLRAGRAPHGQQQQQ